MVIWIIDKDKKDFFTLLMLNNVTCTCLSVSIIIAN